MEGPTRRDGNKPVCLSLPLWTPWDSEAHCSTGTPERVNLGGVTCLQQVNASPRKNTAFPASIKTALAALFFDSVESGI